MKNAVQLAVGAALAVPSAVVAQPAPDYGFDWATVGSPGNRPANLTEAPEFFAPFSFPDQHVGRVDHEFRITRTEVTTWQWLEFANAFWPHWAGSYWDTAITGRWIEPTSNVQGQNPNFRIVGGAENRPVQPSWINAARFVNWLHNGKGTDASDFNDGVYDISSVIQDPDGHWGGPATHAPGSTFWLPSHDEWVKAMHYDPNKNGPGQEGYWRYPNTSDTPPAPGWPWAGGETSAGIPFTPDAVFLDVGSYPDVTSPWGLLDGSGSAREWTETMVDGWRVIRGTGQFNDQYFDAIDRPSGAFPSASLVGFRIATIVPAPATALILIQIGIVATRRRKPVRYAGVRRERCAG